MIIIIIIIIIIITQLPKDMTDVDIYISAWLSTPNRYPHMDDDTFCPFETLMHVLYRPKLHRLFKNQQLEF
jgi:hypothetical protein